MHRLKPLYYMHKHFPDLSLLEESLRLLMILNFLKQVSIVSVLHDNAEGAGRVVKESFLVAYHEFAVDRSQYSYFVQSILFFFLGKSSEFYLLKSIDLII